ncbi:MAG: lysozyme inhibitor LprI family protein [Chitinispirillales bacterium]|jgi:uncharacterized protein YecT (DUF1311 family)|nr:lysozyme inhibitor LprI family protein [Chitinispirillales bacterium]
MNINIAKLSLLATIFIAASATAAFSANAAITKEEWATLMQNPDFKEAEKTLGDAYKTASAALPAEDKQALLKEQRAWAAKRERDAFANFGKGTPGYTRALIEMAYERVAKLEQYHVKTSQFVQTVKFRDKAIPITIFYHIAPAGEFFGDAISLDSLAFTYDNAKRTHRLKPTELYYQVDDIDNFSPLEVDIDYNFDNHMDIGIVTQRGNTAYWKHIYIYDPKTKSYAFQETLSELPNLGNGNDPKKQTLYSHINNGHAGLMYESNELKWKNGKPTLTFTEKQDYDGDDLDTYTRITRRLQNNGAWVEEAKRLSREEAANH